MPAKAGHPRLCARHGADLGGASPLRADWPEPLAEVTALQRCRVGRKPEAKLGADEQEPDTRPVRWGNPQWTGKPKGESDTRTGKSGSARGKDQRFTLGDLPISPDVGAGGRRRPPMGREKSAEAIVVRVPGEGLNSTSREQLGPIDGREAAARRRGPRGISDETRRRRCATAPAGKAEPDLGRPRSHKRLRHGIMNEP